MKKILVTGADGFIGSHLVEKLIDLNYEVKAFCIYNSQGSWGWLDSINQSKKDYLEVFLGDIRDLYRLDFAMSNVDIVIHAAALKQVPAAEYNPMECIKTNTAKNLLFIS